MRQQGSVRMKRQGTIVVFFACQGPFGVSDPSRTSISGSSLPSDASGFADQARHHVQQQRQQQQRQQQQRQQQQLQQPGSDSFVGFNRQESARTPTAGLWQLFALVHTVVICCMGCCRCPAGAISALVPFYSAAEIPCAVCHPC